MQLKYLSVSFVLSTIYAKFANIDYCIAEQMGNFFFMLWSFTYSIVELFVLSKFSIFTSNSMYLWFVPVDVKCYCFACCHVCALLLFYVLLYYHKCSHTNTVQVNNSLKYTV